MFVRRDVKAVSSCDLVLQRFDTWLFELDDHAARHADEVVVVGRCIIGQFVPTQTISETPFGSDAAFREQLQRAIHRRVTDAFVARAYFTEQIFDGRVGRNFEERVNDQTSLSRRAQALFQHVGVKPSPQTIEGDFVFRHGDVPPACDHRAT